MKDERWKAVNADERRPSDELHPRQQSAVESRQQAGGGGVAALHMRIMGKHQYAPVL